MRACECGCGLPVNNRFVVGHNGGKTGQRKPRTEFICENCSKPFLVLMHPNNQRKTCRFCSTNCRDEFRRRHKGPEHPNYKRVETECRVCLSKFFVIPSLVAKGTTCSKECGRIARARVMKNVNRKRSPHRTDWRKEAKERDGFKCRICGFSEIIHTHHINAKRLGGKHTLDNLITLCPNHHAMVHAGMIGQAKLAEAIAAPLPPQNEMPLGRVLNFRK